MSFLKESRIITSELVGRYAAHLNEQEKAPTTVSAYIRVLAALVDFLPDGTVTKTALIGWKEDLAERYAPDTVNLHLAALAGFLAFWGWDDCRV